ncbi:zinc ABC transporter substrate-binding protein [Paracoccus sp. (in: a-proteobacteria)]|uniref:zinc ABC transporter substrate-binding protein n=1 Tax=Paracoccus sp. TaxID=267 RepID=UPI0032203075
MSPNFLLPLVMVTALAGPALAEVPRVLADTPVTASLAALVMGDLGQPEVLVPQGGDPHHFQLRPSQARSLQDSDLLVWVGPALTPWLQRAASGLGPGAQSLALQDLAPGGVAGDDPHAWLDPDIGRAWLQAIAAALAARDPDHAETYAGNARRAGQEIADLDRQLQALLAPQAGKGFVVLHDAYGHFTSHFGLAPAIAIGAGDAASPSAARLRDIGPRIRAAEARCAFGEANHDPRLLDGATQDMGLRRGADLDPEGAAAPPGPGLYAALLRNLGQALADCLND